MVIEIEYNKNYILKNVGYFHNYIYSYADYIINKNVLEPRLMWYKAGILCFSYKKTGLEENITGLLYFDNDYNEFLFIIDTHIQQKIKSLEVKELKGLSIIIKIWMFTEITDRRAEIAAQKVFDKKLIKFQKVVDYLVDYKVKVGAGLQLSSKFLLEKILTKELKPVLHIKVEDEIKQTECLSHLLNLMLKKWKGVDHYTFKYYFHKAIKGYQDNFEHNDAWEYVQEKKDKSKKSI